jgi:acyl-CoA hydrolase
MQPKTFYTHHLIKSEELNHHGTLYAGRSAEWFVEAGFIAAAALVKPQNIVCLQIHGMVFKRPVKLGEVVCYESKIILTGKSSLVAFVRVTSQEEIMLDGFLTFIDVDSEGHSQPHGIVIEPSSDEEAALQQRAREVTGKK